MTMTMTTMTMASNQQQQQQHFLSRFRQEFFSNSTNNSNNNNSSSSNNNNNSFSCTRKLRNRNNNNNDNNNPESSSIFNATPTSTTPLTATVIETIMKENNSNNNNTNTTNDNILQEKDVDALLAKELNQMSIQEREIIFEEIHGVGPAIRETEELIQQKLQEMEYYLQQYSNTAATTTTTTGSGSISISGAASASASTATNASTTSTNSNLATANAASIATYLACKDNNEYIQSREFRLKFLRCENFHSQKAAVKLMDYLHGMLEYFGLDVLRRPLCWSDLDLESQQYLATGMYQLVHDTRDTAGRAIMFDYHLRVKKLYKHPETLVKTVLFLFSSAIEDEMTQKRGLVTISYFVGKFEGEFSSPTHKKLSAVQKWFPIKLPAVHLCFDDPILRAWTPLGRLLMGPHVRQRLRIHDGSHTECVYALLTFGVPVDALPVDYQGNLKTENHHKWLAQRKAKDSMMLLSQEDAFLRQLSSGISSITNATTTNINSTNKSNIMDCRDQVTAPTATTASTLSTTASSLPLPISPSTSPKLRGVCQETSTIAIASTLDISSNSSTSSSSSNTPPSATPLIDIPLRADVILRRGRVYQEHPGNVRMRSLLEEFKQEYDATPNGEKGRISMKIVNIIKMQDQGRFLTQDPKHVGHWVEVSDKEAQRRVSKSFRTARSAANHKNKQKVPGGQPKDGKHDTMEHCNNNIHHDDDTGGTIVCSGGTFKETGFGNKRLRLDTSTTSSNNSISSNNSNSNSNSMDRMTMMNGSSEEDMNMMNHNNNNINGYFLNVFSK